MGQKDLTGKNFILYPDVYADTLNALAYAGREVVHADDLLPAPTESFYHVEHGKLTDQFSDAAMHEMRDGMVHGSQTYPIVSLMLYWGAASSNQPVTLKELFLESDLDEGIWKHITNVKLCVYDILLNAGRIDDLRRASTSKRYRNQLYKEFGMV